MKFHDLYHILKMPKEQPEMDEKDGKRLHRRTWGLLALTAALLGSYLFILYDAQVVNVEEYRQQAGRSIAQTETVESSRGEIVDSMGRVLVTNATTYNVSLDTSLMGTAEERNAILVSLLDICRDQGITWEDTLPIVSDGAGGWIYSQEGLTNSQLRRFGSLCQKLELTPALLDDLGLETCRTFYSLDESLSDSQAQAEIRRREAAGLSAGDMLAALREKFGADPALEQGEARDLVGVVYELMLRSKEIENTEYVFTQNVDITFITLVKEEGLTGVSIDVASTRQYNTTSAAHVLGVIGKMDSAEYYGTEDTEGYQAKGYALNAYVGKSGVERAFESYLHGTSGLRALETDANGKIVDETWLTEPQPGHNVALTLDISFQTAVEDALDEFMSGLDLEEDSGAAVAVVDMTGGVLALASYPTYNLATYRQDYNDLLADPAKPLNNRATSGLYMPGSTFKMVTAAAGLMEGVVNPWSTITCRGSQTFFGNDTRYCHNRGGHGAEDVTDAITDSCNIFFYNLGYQMGISTLGSYASQFGLGQNTGIEIGDKAGYVAGPETSEELGVQWYGGNVLSAAIGQDNNLFTPIQLANYVATLVNGGDRYQVHLLDSVKSSDYSQVVLEYEPTVLSSIDLSDSYVEAIKEGMYGVTQSSSLRAYFNALPVKAGAKTGTAQINNNTGTNALFVAFAPYDDPQIALCVVVEDGASGSSLGRLAAQILGCYFTTEETASTVEPENQLIH